MVTFQLFMLSSLQHVDNGRHGVKNFTLVRIRPLPTPVPKRTSARLSWWFQQIKNKGDVPLTALFKQPRASGKWL
mgnify:CR=1 FL=1